MSTLRTERVYFEAMCTKCRWKNCWSKLQLGNPATPFGKTKSENGVLLYMSITYQWHLQL